MSLNVNEMELKDPDAENLSGWRKRKWRTKGKKRKESTRLEQRRETNVTAMFICRNVNIQ